MSGSDPTAAAVVAEWAVAARERALPADVAHEALRCMLNFVGCAIGGTTHDVVRAMDRALSPLSGPHAASAIGLAKRVDPLLAAMLNGASASAHSFDDTHAEAVVHPGAPVCAAALAAAQLESSAGGAMLVATALGVEICCRLSKAISVPPAEGDIAWYQTGICGGIGAAVAAGTLLRLDATQMRNAIGIAVATASGSRIFQGSMPMLMLAGHAAKCGLRAALLAREGFDSPANAIDGAHGFAAVFSHSAHLPALTSELGERHEILANRYKAYPCGVVLHPVVDACLALHATPDCSPGSIARVDVRLHPVALQLTDRPRPQTRTEAQVSLQHWTAVALVTGRAGLPEGDLPLVGDPMVATLRECVAALPDAALPRDAVEVTVHRRDGRLIASGRYEGSPRMSDAALEAKFRAQVQPLFGPGETSRLLAALSALPLAADLAPLATLL